MIDETTEQDLSEAEEEIASALSLPELPTVNEQIRAIEEPMAALYASEIAVPADAVDEVLRAGTNQKHGHLRITYNFMIDQTPEEYTEFVKREYGTGGKGLVIGGKEYSIWFDELGMQVAVGHTVTDKLLDKAFLSWEDVSGRIGQLLAQGTYAPQVVLDAARDNALEEHAQMLAYMEKDMAEGVAELVFADMEVFQGGYPDTVERIASLLEQPEFLADLNDRLEGFAAAYEEDPELMRFRTYNPVRVAAQFRKFAKDAVPYQAREGYAWEEHGHFITQDEVDAFLSGGGPYSDGRLSTYSYFSMEHTDAEKASFLKERYGTGGSSHALSGADDSHADYDAKGLRLERGSYGDPYAKEFLTWPKVAQRVDYLIKQDKFLKPSDFSRMDAYEKERMADRVRSFYSRLPVEVQRPFPDDFFGEQSRAFLVEALENEGRAEDLIAHMAETLATLPLDFDRYDERAQILTDLIQYTEGTYTLFPERKREPEMVTGRQMTLFDLMGMAEPEETVVSETETQATERSEIESQENPFESADIEHTPEPVAEHQQSVEPENQTEQAVEDSSSETELSEGFVPVTKEDEIPFEKAKPNAAQELQPLGADAAAEYNAIKERYPNTLVGFEQHGRYEFYGEDARLASQILGSKLLEKQTDNGVVDVTGFPSGQWVYYSKQLWSRGESVYLAGEMEDGRHREVKYLSGKEYLPLDAIVHIDGREFRIDSVDYQRGQVSLQDMTMAKEARYPIFRVEPTGYVRALYEEEEPEFDFDTENRVANAMEYTGVSHEDFSGEQMDVIYDAALKGLNIEPMLNPDFSPEQMQLIADIAERTKAGERAAFEGVMAPISGHVMTPEEINAVRRSYRLPLDTFEPVEEEPETAEKDVFGYQGYHFKAVGVFPKHGDFTQSITEAGHDDEPLMSSDEDADIPYDYMEFYRASGTPGADIFLCIETGERYIPGSYELFAYDGEYAPYLGEEERTGETERTGEPDITGETGKEPSERTGGSEPKLKSIVLELNPQPQERQERVNFHITDDDLGAGGPKAKFKANMDAIRLLKELEENGRLANAEEQEVLSRFVGWGGIPQAFDAENASWASEYAEVKEVLSPEEYREARASTLNAFYTSPTVIKAMYSALENMGLRSGNVLEPSCGIGNFMGLVPESMDGLKMYGVELDSISGRIAQQLYQKNKIAVQGFETAEFPDSFFDCTIGNVPFGSYKLNDPKYDRHNFMIHDYFIARSIDLVRPGGVVAVVTSSGTMDKKDDSVRRYFANRADLLGAVRLPDNAFMRNANTGVVADILFFQKRDRASLEEPDWVHLAQTPEGYTVNSYFVQHPEMVLGRFSMENTQYGRQETTVKSMEGADLAEQLREAVSHIHGTITEVELDDAEIDGVDTSIPADPAIKNFSFANVDGHVYYRENSRMNLMELPKATTERVLGMIELRDTVQALLALQVEEGSDAEVQLLQQKLNKEYDIYTAQYGLISSTANRRAFSQDSSYCLLASLELLDEEGNLKRKADIFTKRTIRRATPVTSVDTASEALAISIGERARVDVPFMAQLAGKTEDEITEELSGVIFKNPITDKWETSDEYLSGNVREKLAIARQFAETHPEYDVNVAYLERVQPKDLEASEIEVRLGATWIRPEYINQFMAETFHGERTESSFQTFPNVDLALGAYVELPNHFDKEIGMESTETPPSRMALIRCKNGVDTVYDMEEESLSGKWVTPETLDAQNRAQFYLDNHDVKIAYYIESTDHYIAIQTVSEGYDYTIYDGNFHQLDGGVYDNTDISIIEAMEEILSDTKLSAWPGHREVMDYSELMEKASAVARDEISKTPEKAQKMMQEEKPMLSEEQQEVIPLISDRTEPSQSLHGKSMADIEETVLCYAQAEIDSMGLQDEVKILGARVYGSRSREGLYTDGSDLDVVLSYTGNIGEDSFFNALHESGLTIGGMPVDINPISTEKTGTLTEYLQKADQYLDEKAAQMAEQTQAQDASVKQEPVEPRITFYVAECMEFPILGEWHEEITSLSEAVVLYEKIPAERMNGIKGIGFTLYDGSMYDGMPQEMMSAGIVDRADVNEIQQFKESPLVQKALDELEAVYPPERTEKNVVQAEVREASVHEERTALEPEKMPQTVQEKMVQTMPAENSKESRESNDRGSAVAAGGRKESVLQALRDRRAKMKEQEKTSGKEQDRKADRKKGEQSL